MYLNGQTSRRQTNERGHIGKGEALGGTILLQTWWLIILMWRLWTRSHHQMPCRMGQIQRAPAHSHIRLIFHHMQRKSLQFARQEHHAWCKRNRDKNCVACNPMTGLWPAVYEVSPQRTKSASKRRRSSTTWRKYSTFIHSGGIANSHAVMVGYRKSRNLNPQEVVAVFVLR